MMYEISKTFEFDTAHRLMRHPGKCKSLHGHRYKVKLVIRSTVLGDDNMVLDFGALKETVGAWIDHNWDHNTILEEGDPLIKPLQELAKTEGTKSPYVMKTSPTAEAMAELLRTISNDTLRTVVKVEAIENGEEITDLDIVSRVYIRETPSSWAGNYE